MNRNWCFTVNDNDDVFNMMDFNAISRKTWFRYMVIQEENGGVNAQDTKHYQGYLECKRSTRLLTIKNLLPGAAHLETRQGTPTEARDYCMKEDTRTDGPWEWGEFTNVTQGRRTDLHELARVILEEGLPAAVDQMPWLIIRYPRGVQYYQGLLDRDISLRTVKTTLLYGPTGTGKSMYAYLKDPYAYRKDTEGRFFDHYEGENTMILDDFAGRASKVSLVNLLKLLDIYPIRIETKGDSKRIKVVQFYITTNIHPRMWYNYESREGQYAALARRIQTVLWVPRREEYITVTNDSFFNFWAETCDEAATFQVTNGPRSSTSTSQTQEQECHPWQSSCSPTPPNE